MKPENISDITQNFVNEFCEKFGKDLQKITLTNDDPEDIIDFYRSQIEQLLGRIDTEKKNFPELESDDFDDGYNQKSSEITNQIKKLIH